MDVAVYGGALIAAFAFLFAAFLTRTCQQGDWLTCSGAVTYSTLGSVMRVVAVVVPVAVIVGNFLVLDAWRGSIGMRLAGLCVVDHASGAPVSARRRVLRAVLNTALLLLGAAVTVIPSVVLIAVAVEYNMALSGRRRMLDWVLRTDVREMG